MDINELIHKHKTNIPNNNIQVWYDIDKVICEMVK